MNKIQLFEDRTIRTAWDEEEEEWYFSVVDVVSVLTKAKMPPPGENTGINSNSDSKPKAMNW